MPSIVYIGAILLVAGFFMLRSERNHETGKVFLLLGGLFVVLAVLWPLIKVVGAAMEYLYFVAGAVIIVSLICYGLYRLVTGAGRKDKR